MKLYHVRELLDMLEMVGHLYVPRAASSTWKIYILVFCGCWSSVCVIAAPAIGFSSLHAIMRQRNLWQIVSIYMYQNLSFRSCQVTMTKSLTVLTGPPPHTLLVPPWTLTMFLEWSRRESNESSEAEMDETDVEPDDGSIDGMN